jgi:hypothetical protein
MNAMVVEHKMVMIYRGAKTLNIPNVELPRFDDGW